jgi:arylsulfatase
MGRNIVKDRQDGERLEQPSLPAMQPTDLQPATVPVQTRDGFPVRQGPHVFPGPADTYIAYGRGWATVSNTPFREYKHWVHEGGISTPLIAYWRRGIAARGELRRQPGHLIDVMATCVELAETAYPADAIPLEGRSLVPAFAGQPIQRDALFWEHEGNRAIRVGDWKAVAKGPGATWELYNIATDRVEAYDLAASEADRLKALVSKWEQYARRTHALPWIWKPAYTE